jgi:chitinase
MAGSWDSTSGHQAPIYKSATNTTSTKFSADEAITYYIANGVPAHKLVLGMPLYGRAFYDTAGPGTSYAGIGAAEQPYSWEAGVYDYKALPRPGAQEFFDANAVASWSYDAGARKMVSYDTVQCERTKCGYIKSKGLGGAMWWELSGDRNDAGSLVQAVAGELGSLDQSENCLSFPQSKYGNLQKGFPNE